VGGAPEAELQGTLAAKGAACSRAGVVCVGPQELRRANRMAISERSLMRYRLELAQQYTRPEALRAGLYGAGAEARAAAEDGASREEPVLFFQPHQIDFR
jgi:hypothetical protein